MNTQSSIWTQFNRFSERSLMEMESAAADGKKIAGIYCIFAPSELIRAAGAVPVGLCGKQQAPIPAAEEVLPAALCPLIKSSYGYAVTDTCPFFAASDFIVAETTCDGKKKMFELLADLKPLHLMHLPYTRDLSAGLEYWHAGVLRLRDFLEAQTGNRIRDNELRRQIQLHNRMRKSFQQLMQLNRPGREPVPGMDLLPVLESKGFAVDLENYLDLIDQLIAEIRASQEKNIHADRPRILLTGTPLGKGSEKVLRMIEDAGAVVVGMENCSGIKGMYQLVDEEDPDPFMAIARRYLETPCACMTPNSNRMALISQLIYELGVDGVVDLSWQCCHPYQIESNAVERRAEGAAGVPYLNVSTDYSESDTGQLRVRIEAFLEVITA